MNMLLEEYRYSLQLMHDQSKYAESKNASLIVFTSALSFGLLSNIDNIRKLFVLEIFSFLPVYKEEVYIIGIITIVIILITATVLSLLSFFHQIKQTNLESLEHKNMYFFRSNAEFANCIKLDRYYQDRYQTPSRIRLDMCNQILNLSKIAERKYKYFKKATLVLLMSPAIVFITCTIFYILV